MSLLRRASTPVPILRRRAAARAWHWALWLGMQLSSAPGVAQEPSTRLHVRAMLSGTSMISDDQVRRLGYDTFGLLTGAQLGYAVSAWLDVQLSVAAGAFPSFGRPAGGLLTPLIGATAGVGQSIRVYGQLDLGPGYSGQLMRPFIRAGVGTDFRITTALALGPTVGYGQLVQTNGPGDSSDARFLSFGVAASFRPGALSQPTSDPPQTRLRTVVLQPPKEKSLPPSMPSPEPSPELLTLIEQTLPSTQLELLAPVLFEFDSDLLEPSGVAMLHEVVQELAHRTEIELLEIQGYSDRRGDAAYNEQLSARRATRVREWLVEHGVDESRLRVAGKGASNFVEAGQTAQSHEQNRRVVFRVVRTKAR